MNLVLPEHSLSPNRYRGIRAQKIQGSKDFTKILVAQTNILSIMIKGTKIAIFCNVIEIVSISITHVPANCQYCMLLNVSYI